jgi:hypothetical protein
MQDRKSDFASPVFRWAAFLLLILVTMSWAVSGVLLRARPMSDYLETAFSGWAGVMLFGAGLAMPYLLRKAPQSRSPYLRRMWPHYWLGYLAFLVSFVHAWFAMRTGNMRGINSAGVWIATVALFVILWQIAVGLMLRNPTEPNRRALRRTHFWTMASVAGLIVVHITLNRP